MQTDFLKRNNVKITGTGEQVLMMAHGFGCDQNMWRFVIPAFEKNYKIVLFDYVGCGKSDITAYNPERYSTLDGYAHDVLEICEALNLNNINFIGHSVSSMVGALAAIQKPDLFNSMIMIGPSPRYINELPDYKGGFERKDLEGLLDVMDNNYIGWASYLAPVVMQNPERPNLTKELEESFCSTDPVITRKFAEVTFFSDNRADLSKIRIPCLIMQCSDDAIAPDEVGEYTHKHIQDSEFVKMDASGHCPHMSHPEETIAIIQKFLVEKEVY